MHQQQEDLEPVGPRRRVLERVRGVGVVEAAAVGAELLDGLLAGDRAAGDGLRSRRRACVTSGRAWKFWIMPPADEDDRDDDRRSAAGCAGRSGSGRPRSCRAGRCVLRAKPRTSAIATAMPTAAETKFCTARPAICDEVAQRVLTRVRLPVGVRDEAGRGVERLIGRHLRNRVRRPEMLLHAQEHVEEQHGDGAEREHRTQVTAPGLVGVRVDPARAVDAALDREMALAWSARAPCSRRAACAPAPARAISVPAKMMPAHVVLIRTSPGTPARSTRKTVTSDGQDQPDQVRGAHSFSAPFAINARIAKTRITSSTNSTSCTRNSNKRLG